MIADRCKGCHALVVWITTTAGKNMICEAEPVRFNGDGKGKRVTLVLENGVVVVSPHDGMTGYVPHWGSCPRAVAFRRKKDAANKR